MRGYNIVTFPSSNRRSKGSHIIGIGRNGATEVFGSVCQLFDKRQNLDTEKEKVAGHSFEHLGNSQVS